jgi:glycine/D-amino acid oxidase-like deaminating enzyme
MPQQYTVAIVGAGVIGCAVAYALAREGHQVLVCERGEPETSGASYGNVAHVAAELVQPLPSPTLLLGFWRELFACDGPLDIPLRRLPALLPWAARFAAAAFRRTHNTQQLAPLVRGSTAALARWLAEIGRSELLRRHGHYEIWLGGACQRHAAAQQRVMRALEVVMQPVTAAELEPVRRAAGARQIAALLFPDSGHVTDPLLIMQAFADAARQRGAQFRRAEVTQLGLRDTRCELRTAQESFTVDAVVVCAGVWSASLLESFGLNVPLEAVRGYHVELPGHAALLDAPVLYADEHLLVTPLAGRLRASSYMEFLPAEAPADPRKPQRLRSKLRRLGYHCDPEGSSWVGPRPVLPDYLPGIGRVRGAPRVHYAIAHQHIGLTTAAVTAELIADLIAQRTPRLDISGFDLERFGAASAPRPGFQDMNSTRPPTS